MFLKKSLLFTTALALLLFAGQASAQGVSFKHVPNEGGTEGVVSGPAGTTFVVELSITGITIPAIYSYSFTPVFDGDLLELTSAVNGKGDDLTGLFSISGFLSRLYSDATVPPAVLATITFTTKKEIAAGDAFSVGIDPESIVASGLPDATLAAVKAALPGAAMFNADGGTDPVDPVDPVDPPMAGDGVVSLTSGGATIVRGVAAGGTVEVAVAVGGMTGAYGGSMTFVVEPAVATVSNVAPAEGLLIVNQSGMSVTLAGPPMDRGNFATVTFTANDGGMFSISVSSFDIFTTPDADKEAATPGAPLVVNKPLPTLMGPDGDVMIMPGGEASAMVTAAGFDGDVTFDGAAEDGTVTASAPGEVVVTATDGMDPESASATINFVWGDITVSADPEGPVTVMPGGSGSATLTTSGQAEGADVMYRLEEGSEGATLDGATVSASGAATAIVTAWVGDVGSDPVTVMFEQGPLTLEGPAEVAIGADGGMATVTASGQAEGAEVTYALSEGSDGTLDGATVSANVAGTATVTASVGDIVSNAVEITFVPSLVADMTEVTIPRDGPAMITATAYGFSADANVNFIVTAGTDVVSSDDGSTLTLTKSTPGEVMVYATDGTNTTATLTIAFMPTPPELVSDAADDMVAIPVGGSAMVVITALDFGDGISYQTEVTEGVATVDAKRDGANLELTVSGTGSATVAVTADDGTNTDTIEIKFTAGELTLEAGKSEVMVPVGGTGSTTVTASGQANDDDVTFAVEGEGVMSESDGATVTLTASGAATATVTVSVGDVSATMTVEFVDGALTLALAEGSAAENTVLPGGSASATVALMNLAEGDEASFTVEASEGVTAEEGETAVTLSSSGAGSATVTAMVNGLTTGSVTVEFMLGELTAALAEGSSAENTVLPGGSASATVMASGQAEGAEVAFALEDGSEGVELDAATGVVSASGAGTAIVTAWVGEVGSNAVTIEFAQGALTLAGDTEAIIPYGGSGSAMLTASGQADGAEVVFTVEGDGVTSESDGATVTVSASAPTMATVTADVGGVTATAEVAFMDAPPELHTETPTVTFADFGETGVATVTAVGFPEDAEIKFKIVGGAGFATADGAATWTVSTAVAGVVTLVAEDGTTSTEPLDITFMNPRPYLTASDLDAIIPTDGSVIVTVTATGLDAGSEVWTFREVTGTATVNTTTHGATATLTGSGEGSASVTLAAEDGTNSTEPITIVFRAMPTASSETPNVTVPPTTAPSESATVTVEGFAEDTAVEIAVVVVSGSEDDVTYTMEGNTVTVSSVGSAVVEVTASGDGVTTDPVTLTFTKDAPAAPANLVVEDNPGDHGYYVMVSFPNSANHLDVSQYRIWREMDVTTELGEDGTVRTTDDPAKAWVAWAAVDAVPSEEGVTRAVVPVTDNTATRWGVSAEVGRGSAEDVITPSGKRVFSKESVQLMAQILGLDPNAIVSEDELAQMFMPSADYIQSILGDRKNVVFAALDPDMSVLIGDATVPQNIRTSGHRNPILSSPITETEDMTGALDDTAPVAVTDITADPDTGLINWTISADDMVVGMISYRGYSFTIPGVVGYKVMAGATPDALAIDVTQLVVETGVLPAGTSSLQVPRALIETLIDQGLPAVFVSVVAMDGTNMTPSVPLMVELAPKRKAFVDGDGNPVYIVDLNDGNLRVGFEDFIAFTMAYNTSEATSSREEWRVFIQADLNDDTMVDFADFILFFESYGREAIGPAGKSLIPPPGVNESAEFLLRLGSDRVVAGENMFVDVSLANVQALMGYGFVLHYDAEIFEFVEAVPAVEDLLMSSGGETPLLKGWSPEAGQVHVMNSIVNGSEVSGDGDIVRLVFRVLRDFEDNARFEIADGLVFDPSQLANPLIGGVLDIQTTPTEFALLQNFPNPFNPETTIGYELAESADVTLQIYNVVGQVVRTLMVSESQSVGRYQVRWDGMDDRGMPVSSGIYFYQISAGKFQDVRKLMLLK